MAGVAMVMAGRGEQSPGEQCDLQREALFNIYLALHLVCFSRHHGSTGKSCHSPLLCFFLNYFF